MFRIALISLLLLLSGCVTSLVQLQKIEPTGSPFQTYLAREYLDFAEDEADQYDWYDSAYFARKGLKAAKGIETLPESPGEWGIDAKSLTELNEARGRLMKLLSSGITQTHPEESAKMQFFFDCWVEQQEEGWQVEHISYCREHLYNMMDNVFGATPKAATAITPHPEGTPPTGDDVILQTKETKPVIYFDNGSSELNEQAKRTVSNIISGLKDKKVTAITLNGYADKTGNEDANMVLSKKRAQTVKKAFADAGFDEKSITIFAFGEEQGASGDKNKSAEGRYVEVVISY